MIRLGASARSAIEVDVFDGQDDEHDPASYATLRACYANGSITVPADHWGAVQLNDALTELANTYDATAEDSIDAEERRFARDARRALTTAASKVLATIRKVA